jgi:hypothetical protein
MRELALRDFWHRHGRSPRRPRPQRTGGNDRAAPAEQLPKELRQNGYDRNDARFGSVAGRIDRRRKVAIR